MNPAIIALCAFLLGSTKIDDPANDDHGPGGYVYPSDALVYKRGSYDLRSLEVEVDKNKDQVVFTVTLGQKISAPARAKRSNATEIPLRNNIYIQNVDIYIDRDPSGGFTETIPGRNVDIAADNAWDSAVVLTPQPALTRSMIDDWKPSRRVLFPANVVAIGSKLVARVDAVELGGLPSEDWGYQVLITGATWEPSFEIVRRFVNEQGINAFTMLVQTLPEAESFGGGGVDLIHPMVIDMLAPPGRTQEAILSGYEPATKKRAVVPLVYPNEAARARARAKLKPPSLELPTSAPSPEYIDLKIRDVQGETVVLERAGQELEPYRMGQVLDAAGQNVCKLVITSVHPAFFVGTAVECGSALRPGAITRFEKKVPKE